MAVVEVGVVAHESQFGPQPLCYRDGSERTTTAPRRAPTPVVSRRGAGRRRGSRWPPRGPRSLRLRPLRPFVRAGARRPARRGSPPPMGQEALSVRPRHRDVRGWSPAPRRRRIRRRRRQRRSATGVRTCSALSRARIIRRPVDSAQDGIDKRDARLVAYPQYVGHGPHHIFALGQARQLHPSDAIRELRRRRVQCLNSQARLADAPGARDRHDPRRQHS